MAFRNQGSFSGVTAELEDVVFFKIDTDRVSQPLSCRKSVRCHNADDFRVALEVAALKRIGSHSGRSVVLNIEFVLNPRIRNVHFSAGNQRVSADGRHFFNKNNVSAFALSFNCGSKTRTACTDNHYVVILNGRHGYVSFFIFLDLVGEFDTGFLCCITDGV